MHISVAAYLGIGKNEPARKRMTDSDIAELQAVAGPALPKFRHAPRMIH